MKPKLIFATGNKNKVREINKILGAFFDVLPMSEIGCTEDIAETADTFEGNALIKVRYLKENYQVDCFGEDTGLEVEALNNAPGVFTARYAGPEKDANANMGKLLTQLGDNPNRAAQFRTVVALIFKEKEYLFEGICKGQIAMEKKGTDGFGYDPVFIPDGYDRSFAEMTLEEKNTISHRGIAIGKLKAFFDTLEV